MAGRQVVYDRGQALSTINGLLKEHYISDQIVEAVNKATVLLSRLKSEQTTHGRQYIFPVELGVSQGSGARAENAPLPNPGFGEYEQATGTVVYLYHTLSITGQSIDATAGNKAAFASALKTAIKNCREGTKLDVQRQVWGDGTGVLGLVDGAVTASNIVPVKQPFGLTYGGALDPRAKTQLFRRGMSVFIDQGTPVASTVAGINSDGTITLADNVTLTTDAVIYRGDVANDPTRVNKDLELHGLTKFISASGTYLGIDRAGIPEWQGNIVAAGGALTEEKMRIAMDTSIYNGNAEPDLVITDLVTRRRYESLLVSLKRFVKPMELEGGHTALEFDGKPVVADKDAPPERMWFLHTPDIMWMVMREFGFMQEDGAVLSRVPGYDRYEAVLSGYKNIACKRPANQTVLSGITS